MIETICAYSENPSCLGDCGAGTAGVCDGYSEYMVPDVLVGLCKGRHEMPVTDYIFRDELEPTNYGKMHLVAGGEVRKIQKANPTMEVLGVYVTGLTAALAAVIFACQQVGIGVVLYHYNRDSGEYDSQMALWPKEGV